jgi:hypothetical protein
MRWSFVSLMSAVAVVTFAPVNPAVAEGRRAGRCYAIRIDAAGSSDEGDPHAHRERERDRDHRRNGSALSATEAKDLEIQISVSEDAAIRPVRIKLFTPRGKLYQVLDAVADLEAPEASGHRRSRRNERSLVARFPVAGTQITTHALFGEWRAEVYLDGFETPCSRPLEFALEP